MTKTGGELTSDTTKVFDGGSVQPDVLAGPPQASNIVLTRAYDVDRDGPIIKALKSRVGTFQATISVTPTDRNLNVTDTPATYPNALLVSLQEPDADASSGDAATYQLEFAVSAWK